ncbi:hypothetical protein BKP56_01050 [Marinilactibacillus sp. 15R]|uniref:cupin domain-containing protein n=1 Tax=Marinilactibacillus sp. 15R TaxID=1911586 RepID=UPI0009099D60|nr:cupin domain-containing protein [Marinilactibacillus sp. 15R]API88005.1 hypothetical protein BKP56_01050 [Marinilactibacillus sp. 15R]
MIEQILLKEDQPYPNSMLPVLFYPGAFREILETDEPAQNGIDLFEEHGYANAWVDGIFPYHHFHSNTHEVLACISGEASVQLGGSNGKIIKFTTGDVVLLPAGTAHKRVKASKDFKIIGAYPDGKNYNTYRSEDVTSDEQYQRLKQEIKNVPVPTLDPVQSKGGAVKKYWY